MRNGTPCAARRRYRSATPCRCVVWDWMRPCRRRKSMWMRRAHSRWNSFWRMPVSSRPPPCMIAVAPGSVWRTKRWPAARFCRGGSGVGDPTQRRHRGVGRSPRPSAGARGSAACDRAGDRRRRAIAVDANCGSVTTMPVICCAMIPASCIWATALGAPVAAVFGPTVQAFGVLSLSGRGAGGESALSVPAMHDQRDGSLSARPSRLYGTDRASAGGRRRGDAVGLVERLHHYQTLNLEALS